MKIPVYRDKLKYYLHGKGSLGPDIRYPLSGQRSSSVSDVNNIIQLKINAIKSKQVVYLQ